MSDEELKAVMHAIQGRDLVMAAARFIGVKHPRKAKKLARAVAAIDSVTADLKAIYRAST